MNDEVREIFRNTILTMCRVSSVNQLPQNVQDAMLLKDYGHGKPLSARRIIAVSKALAEAAAPVNAEITYDRATTLVDGAIEFINGKGKNEKVGKAVLTEEQRDKAARLVAKYGVGMTDACLRIEANYVALAIACGSYGKNPDHIERIASEMAKYLKNVRNFRPGDVRLSKFDAKMTKYWQSMLDDYLNPAKAKMYRTDNIFRQVEEDFKRASFTVCGRTFSQTNNTADEMFDELKQRIPNEQHRKAITTFMNQMVGIVTVAAPGRNALPPTPSFPNLNMESMKGFNLFGGKVVRPKEIVDLMITPN